MSTRLGLRIAEEHGRLLAAWLNMEVKEIGPGSPRQELTVLTAMLLAIAQQEGQGGVARKWERLWEKVEPYGLGDMNIPRLERPVVLDSARWGANVHLVIRQRRGVLTFVTYPADENSRAFWSFAHLIQLGFVDRVRLCPNCRRFFFARRTDSKLCSQPCREALWRKTPQGRNTRAKYMREYRETLKRLGEVEGFRRKPGRKLHLDHKKKGE